MTSNSLNNSTTPSVQNLPDEVITALVHVAEDGAVLPVEFVSVFGVDIMARLFKEQMIDLQDNMIVVGPNCPGYEETEE